MALGSPRSSLRRTAITASFPSALLCTRWRLHVGQLAVDRLFAGVMEMKLLQVVADSVGHDIAAGLHVDFDRVAVVLQLRPTPAM